MVTVTPATFLLAVFTLVFFPIEFFLAFSLASNLLILNFLIKTYWHRYVIQSDHPAGPPPLHAEEMDQGRGPHELDSPRSDG